MARFMQCWAQVNDKLIPTTVSPPPASSGGGGPLDGLAGRFEREAQGHLLTPVLGHQTT